MDVRAGDLLAPLPRALQGRVDVVVGVVPYVPTPDLPLLQRDTLTFESTLSYDGGEDGTALLRRVVADSPRFLRHGGALLLELGGEQADALATTSGACTTSTSTCSATRRATSAASKRRWAPLRTETDLNRLYRGTTSLLTKGNA